MKKIFAVSVAVAVAVILALAVIVLLATPRDWPATAGSIKARKVIADGTNYVMVEGEPMNYIGQMQCINIGLDDSNRFIVTRCFILRSPFSKIVVNNQFPIFYPLADVKPGKYSVVYESSEGEQTAGTFDVP